MLDPSRLRIKLFEFFLRRRDDVAALIEQNGARAGRALIQREDDLHEQSVTPLAYRPPFRWDAIHTFLATRAIDALESFAGNRYQREGITIEQDSDALLMTVSPRDLRPATGDPIKRAQCLFDLNADPIAIDAHLSTDRKLRPLIARRPGTRVPGAWEPFEIAVRAIVGQQISVRATRDDHHDRPPTAPRPSPGKARRP